MVLMGRCYGQKTPICSTIDFRRRKVFEKSKKQLEDKIIRDRNQAFVIILRVGKKNVVNSLSTRLNLWTESVVSKVSYNDGVKTLIGLFNEFPHIVWQIILS